MLKQGIQLIVLAAAAVLTASASPLGASATTSPPPDPGPGVWRLGQDQDWKTISPQDKFLLAVAEAKKLVNTGQTESARKAYEKLKQDFPDIAGADLDAFIEAEMLYSKGKFTKAYRGYEKLLKDHPETKLQPAVLDRQFAIGTAYLQGQEKSVLHVVKLKGDAEGIRIMEKITDRAGIDSPLGLRAAIAVAENYQNREMFNDAHLKWWEISLQRRTGQIAKDALLAMARCKHNAYNAHPEEKRPFYDTAGLATAKTYYLNFKSLYPEDAQKLDIDNIVKQIDEQLAQKQLCIAQYYHRVGNIQAANLYYDMVSNNWSGTQAAESAKKSRAGNSDI
jgi:outer membrane protein assembly factor BamD (BamD/ComL family)